MSPPNRPMHLLWPVVFALSCGSVTSVSIDAPTDEGGAGGSAGGGTTGQGDTGQGGAGQAGAAGGGLGGAGQAGGGSDGGAGAADGGANPCRGLTQVACGATLGCSMATCQGCN